MLNEQPELARTFVAPRLEGEEMIARNNLVNPPVSDPPASWYPGERLFVIMWSLIMATVSILTLVMVFLPIVFTETWTYDPLFRFLAVCSAFLALYSFQIGVGAFMWARTFKRERNKDFYNILSESQQEEWGKVQHFVAVTIYKENLHYVKSVAYTLMSQGMLPNSTDDFDAGTGSSYGSSTGGLGRGGANNFCKQQITLVLAMEKSAGETQINGVRSAFQAFEPYFKDILFTEHPDPLGSDPDMRNGEIRGKASNFRWALKEIDEYVDRKSLDPEYCLVHVADYDSLFDPNHFPSVTYDFCKQPNDRHSFVWQACMMSTCNFWELYPGVRQMTLTVTAQEMMSAMHRWCGEFQIPFSTYGMMLPTLRQIGGGEAGMAQDGDVIAEDHHLFIKGFFATGGELQVKPVYLPCFNFTENGCECIEDCRKCRSCCCLCKCLCGDGDSRFTQAVRHMFALAELAYFFSLLYRSGFSLRRYGIKGKNKCRALFLGLKLLKIHAVGYLGLWVFFGFLCVFMILCHFTVCHFIWQECETDSTAIMSSTGYSYFGIAGAVAMVGSILACASFAKMLYATNFRLENIAHPAGAFMGTRFFRRLQGSETAVAFERLVPIRRAEPWCGIMIQLIFEQVVAGVVGALYYGTLPAIISLKRLCLNGHKMKYVSSTGNTRPTESGVA